MDRKFQKWERVKVVQNHRAPREEKYVLNRTGEFMEYTGNGYAKVKLDGKTKSEDGRPDVWLIHPENLEREAER